MQTLKLIAIAAVSVVWVATASAQVCTLDDSEQSCLKKLDESLSRQLPQAVGNEIALRNTGVVVPNTANGTVNDFLSRFQFALDMGELDEDNEALTFELNRFLPPIKGLKLSTTLAQAEPFEPLLAAAPRDLRETLRGSIEDQLGDFDNTRVSFIYSPTNERFGRRHQDHAGLMSSLIQISKNNISAAAPLAKLEAERVYERVLTDAIVAMGDDAPDEPDALPFSRFPAAHRQALLQATEAYLRAQLADMEFFQADLESIGLFDVANLIDNQPQFYVAAQYNTRDELAGPDEFRIRMAFEMGLHNINALRRYAVGKCQLSRANPQWNQVADLGRCIGGYLDSIGGEADSGRLVFAGEWVRRQSYDIALSDPVSVAFRQPDHSAFVFNLAYGRYVTLPGTQLGDARFDVGISYVDVSDDPMRNDRGFAEATYSHKVTDTSYVTFGLVYSNKPEFRGDVDNEFSARLGLNYKITAFEP